MEKVYGNVIPSGHYTPGIVSRGMLYVAGQPSIDPATGKPAEGGAAAETLCALNRMLSVVEAAGLTKENVVLVHIFMTDGSMWGEVNRVYKEFFGEHKPARVAVPCPPMHNSACVEIDCIAEFPEA